jgi:hypothetical protein
LSPPRGPRRLLRPTLGGLLRIDRAAVNAEAHLDGKFLLRSSDPTLSAADIALAYQQLLQLERGRRDVKTTLDLRPSINASKTAFATRSGLRLTSRHTSAT